MRLLIAALALAVTACSPTTEQSAGAPSGQSAETACAAQGGSMQRVGRMQTLQCVIHYADAGKRCTDGDQCQGDCVSSTLGGDQTPPATSGQCAADSNRFGCRTTIENGRAQPTLCID